MATKKSDNKTMTFDEACAVIDREMATLVRLAGKNGAEGVRAKWEELKKSLRAGSKAKPASAAAAKLAKKPAAAKPAKPAKVAKITRAEADAAKPNVPKAEKDPSLPASVRITDKEVELNLGSFGVRQLAEHDASELIGHPMVFWYRRGVFPDPRQSRVNPTVVSAKAVERKGKAFKSAPFTVRTVISMAGDSAHCLAWAKGVYSRNKGEQE